MHLLLSARGDASATEVWRRYAELERWQTWSPQIHSVDVDGEPVSDEHPVRIAPGLRGQVRSRVGLSVLFEVTDVDAARRSWTWSVRLGLIRLRMTHEVHERGDSTETTLELSGPAPIVLAYAPAARWALGRLVRS